LECLGIGLMHYAVREITNPRKFDGEKGKEIPKISFAHFKYHDLVGIGQVISERIGFKFKNRSLQEACKMTHLLEDHVQEKKKEKCHTEDTHRFIRSFSWTPQISQRFK
jgi:hypothetical protein